MHSVALALLKFSQHQHQEQHQEQYQEQYQEQLINIINQQYQQQHHIRHMLTLVTCSARLHTDRTNTLMFNLFNMISGH